MSAFEFVAAFFGIVVGLGIAQMLSSLSDLLESRERVKTDWIQAVWALNILLLLIHSWWGMWALQAAPSWSYAAFLSTVAYLSTVYLLSTLVFPRVGEQGVVLLNHNLFGQRFISPFVAVPAILVLAVIYGAHTRNRVYHGVLVTAICGMEVALMLLDTTTIQ